jgi:ABC-type lipoprotein release transport system permease subunit
MPNSTFYRFLLLLLYKQKGRHIGVMLIASLLVALLSAVLFISRSIQNDIASTLQKQPDFVVQRLQGGERVNAPLEWLDEIRQFNGVTEVTPRLYGHYYFAPNGEHFLVVGVDLFDEQSSALLEEVMAGRDLRAFYAEDQMIVGAGVKGFLEERYYSDAYNFRNPDGEMIPVKIFGSFDSESRIVSNDTIVTEIGLARRIFGVGEEEVTDIAFNVPNEAEWDNVVTKLQLLHYDLRVITKEEVAKSYRMLYNYKGGIFLALYLVTLTTFMLILYQRFTSVYASERRSIGILRAVGWSIGDILKLKFFESLLIVLLAFGAGAAAAYVYVFMLGAPLLGGLFLGGGNLANPALFAPAVDGGLLGSIFLFFAVPFIASVLVPAWRIAVTEPKEAMK